MPLQQTMNRSAPTDGRTLQEMQQQLCSLGMAKIPNPVSPPFPLVELIHYKCPFWSTLTGQSPLPAQCPPAGTGLGHALTDGSSGVWLCASSAAQKCNPGLLLNHIPFLLFTLALCYFTGLVLVLFFFFPTTELVFEGYQDEGSDENLDFMF